VKRQAQEKGITLAENAIDDVLTVALFPQVGLKFLENRHNPAAFEPVPQVESAQPAASGETGRLRRLHRGSGRQSLCGEGQRRRRYQPAGGAAAAPVPAVPGPGRRRHPGDRAAGGHIWKVLASEGQTVAEGDVLLILEAMKMETEIRAAQAGTVRGIAVKSGDAVAVGDTLMSLA
jgi:oxaloacetate decarboxylase alpha subunit